jgi:RES domain-containing protein
MNETPRHDRALLDALDVPGVPFAGTVWRIVRAGRDTLKGSTLNGRWSGGDYSVLYTSCERAGALAEIGYRLSQEPIWPSRLEHVIHEIRVACERVLDISDLAALAPMGVNTDKYASFDYTATSKISAAANFLEFDAMLVPSARFACANLLIFNERPNELELLSSERVDWDAWRRGR